MQDLNEKLFAAARENNITEVADLLKKGADPNYVQPDLGYTPLLIALEKDHTRVVKTLIAAGADVNFVSTLLAENRQSTEGTALFVVNSVASLQVLLDAGADPTIIGGQSGESLVQRYTKILSHQYPEIIAKYLRFLKLVLEYGAVPHVWYLTDPFQKSGVNALLLYLDAGADIDEPNPEGRTGLEKTIRSAARFQNLKLIKDMYPKRVPLIEAYIDNGARLDPDWIEGVFHPDDAEKILADAAWQRRKQLIILREYLKSKGAVPASSKGSKFFDDED